MWLTGDSLLFPTLIWFVIANEFDLTQIAFIYLQLKYIASRSDSHFALISFLRPLPNLKCQTVHAFDRQLTSFLCIDLELQMNSIWHKLPLYIYNSDILQVNLIPISPLFLSCAHCQTQKCQTVHALGRQLTSLSLHWFEIANESNLTQIALIYLQLRYIASQFDSHFAPIPFLRPLPNSKMPNCSCAWPATHFPFSALIWDCECIQFDTNCPYISTTRIYCKSIWFPFFPYLFLAPVAEF